MRNARRNYTLFRLDNRELYKYMFKASRKELVAEIERARAEENLRICFMAGCISVETLKKLTI